MVGFSILSQEKHRIVSLFTHDIYEALLCMAMHAMFHEAYEAQIGMPRAYI